MSFHAAQTFTFGEQPSATKWQWVWDNDYALADGSGISDDAILARHIDENVIGPNHLALGADSAVVATGQTRTSTSYGDLSTAGPAVTVTIGNNGLALVCLATRIGNNTGGAYSFMSYAASGANTISASDNKCIYDRSYTANGDLSCSWVYLEEGLTPGSTTFTAKYKVDSGTGTFTDRRISVIPL